MRNNHHIPVQRSPRELKSYYIYELEVLALVSGATATDSFNIEANSDFIWTKGMYFADIAAGIQTDGTRVIPLVSIQLIDTGSGRQIFSNPIPISSVFGTGKFPYLLPLPYRFARNATLQGTFTNFDAAATYNIRLAFGGYRNYGPVEAV